jgi:hypothetical protein
VPGKPRSSQRGAFVTGRWLDKYILEACFLLDRGYQKRI